MAFGNHFRFRRDGSRRGDVGNNNPHQNGNLMERKVAKAQGRKAQKLTLGLPSCIFLAPSRPGVFALNPLAAETAADCNLSPVCDTWRSCLQRRAVDENSFRGPINACFACSFQDHRCDGRSRRGIVAVDAGRRRDRSS